MQHLLHLAVDTHVEEPLAAHLLEELAVVSLTGLHQGGEDEDRLPLIVLQYEVDNLLFGILDHLLSRGVGVGLTGTCKEQAQVVVHLGDGAYRRARILVGRLLLDGDHGRQPRHLIHIRALHAPEEVACIGRKGLYIAALTLGKERIEGQRRLARATEARDDRERPMGHIGIDILQVMFAGSVDLDRGAGPFLLVREALSLITHCLSSFLNRVRTLMSPRFTYLMPSAPSASTRMKNTPSSTRLP